VRFREEIVFVEIPLHAIGRRMLPRPPEFGQRELIVGINLTMSH
jgi:hypothetical protein